MKPEKIGKVNQLKGGVGGGRGIFCKNTKVSQVRWLTSVTPTLWEFEAGRLLEVGSLSPVPTWRNPISTKKYKISWAWWYTPVIPVIREAEAGELLELGRWRLQ